ncbi:MAG: DUF6249 domain-containing protein [Gammaproteobacteria bacterium]|nr:DUF6249 domain-containing protein [Gammaproteobacteria bacterium]
MKYLVPLLLCGIMVSGLAVQSAGATEHTAEPDVDSAASPYTARRALKNRIDAEVRQYVAERLEAVPSLSDDERAAILADIEEDYELDGTSPGAMIVGGLAVILIFGTPLLLVAAVLYASHRKRRQTNELAGQFIATGQPLPDELLRALDNGTSTRNSLYRGMISLGLALGIFLAFWLMGAKSAAYLALIPLFLGIALLLIWWIEQRSAAGT